MKVFIGLIVFFSTVSWACFPETHPDYDEWVSVGMPDSWCYARQCRGDTDGLAEGSPFAGYSYVYTQDLALLMSVWTVREPPEGPGISFLQLGADFDHCASRSPYIGYHRIGTNDYCIFMEYAGVKEPPQGPGVPECFCWPQPCDPDPVIDGPMLSLRVKTGASFEDKDSVNVYASTILEIGIVNSSGDKCTCYDGYMSITNGLGDGAWTGASWVYNASILGWTYFGTSPIANMDAWYVETVNPTDSGDPEQGSVSASATYQYTGPGDVTVTLYNEFFEEVDTLTIQGPVAVTSPNGGEVFVSGTAHNILWNAADTITNFDIDYSLDNGGVWQSIVAGTENDGLYSWDPIPVADANDCLVRISDSADALVFDASDDVFTIFTCAIGPIPGDANNDCYVNLEDFIIFCENWLLCGNSFDPLCGP